MPAGERFELTIAGRGEGSKELIRLIARSPAADRIRWVGAVPHDEVPALLREHGILLLTSRYEASPTVVKEALRAMRPVVSTDVGDVADWLETGPHRLRLRAHRRGTGGRRPRGQPADPRGPLPGLVAYGPARRGPADERGAHALSPARGTVTSGRRPRGGGRPPASAGWRSWASPAVVPPCSVFWA